MTEPSTDGLRLVHEHELDLRISCGDQGLARYVYRPREAQLESPRPYFHPVRTLAGDVVSLFRPHDHVWHKGIALSLPNIGRPGSPEQENFWGGSRTCVAGDTSNWTTTGRSAIASSPT